MKGSLYSIEEAAQKYLVTQTNSQLGLEANQTGKPKPYQTDELELETNQTGKPKPYQTDELELEANQTTNGHQGLSKKQKTLRFIGKAFSFTNEKIAPAIGNILTLGFIPTIKENLNPDGKHYQRTVLAGKIIGWTVLGIVASPLIAAVAPVAIIANVLYRSAPYLKAVAKGIWKGIKGIPHVLSNTSKIKHEQKRSEELLSKAETTEDDKLKAKYNQKLEKHGSKLEALQTKMKIAIHTTDNQEILVDKIKNRKLTI